MPIILSSGLLPIVFYFVLRYTTELELNIIVTIPLSVMGVVSLFGLFKRTYFLFKSPSTCRPLGVTDNRWAFDWFNWNFLFGFVVLTVVISIGSGFNNLAIVSLSTKLLLLYVCMELVLVEVGIMFDVKAPWRISSIGRGERLRPGVFVVAEDIIAVDGGMGEDFRKAWVKRYEADNDFQALLRKLDLIWGVSGLAVVAVVWGIVFGVENKDVGYAAGWALPWVWAGSLTLLTISMAKSMLRRQRRLMNDAQL